MSGTNKLVQSEAEGEKESIEELNKDLLNANEAAIKESGKHNEKEE